MDNITKLNLLFDYYGEFLTEKQREIFELYYVNDLSLGEIAEQSGITRQAVYDMVRRSQGILEGFEEKLGMVEKYFKMERELQEIFIALKELEQGIDDEYKGKFSKVLEDIRRLLAGGE